MCSYRWLSRFELSDTISNIRVEKNDFIAKSTSYIYIYICKIEKIILEI